MQPSSCSPFSGNAGSHHAKADRLCGCGVLVRCNHGRFCSGSVRVKPLPPSRWPIPHDFRARRIGRLDVLWKESCRFAELGGESELRLGFYVLTLFFEWLLFILVVSGVVGRLAALSLEINGIPSAKCSEILESLRPSGLFWQVSFIRPHGGPEITLWIALSVTAGICEETVFRGYLQRQFIALTKNVPAGILLSAAHSVPLTRTRASGGDSDRPVGRHVWVHWRGSVRPGIIAHAWQDSLNGVLVGLSRP